MRKVSPERIAALMNLVTYDTHVVPATNATIAVAKMPCGFVLGTGISTTQLSEDFDTAAGVEYAIAAARPKAEEKLWELEAWRVRCEQQPVLPEIE